MMRRLIEDEETDRPHENRGSDHCEWYPGLADRLLMCLLHGQTFMSALGQLQPLNVRLRTSASPSSADEAGTARNDRDGPITEVA